MKIARVDTELYHVPLSKPMQDATHGVQRDFSLAVVKITTADGVTGMGYTYSVGQVGGTSIAALIKDNLEPILIGEDPRRIEQLWNEDVVGASTTWRLQDGIAVFRVCAAVDAHIEVACRRYVRFHQLLSASEARSWYTGRARSRATSAD